MLPIINKDHQSLNTDQNVVKKQTNYLPKSGKFSKIFLFIWTLGRVLDMVLDRVLDRNKLFSMLSMKRKELGVSHLVPLKYRLNFNFDPSSSIVLHLTIGPTLSSIFTSLVWIFGHIFSL